MQADLPHRRLIRCGICSVVMCLALAVVACEPAFPPTTGIPGSEDGCREFAMRWGKNAKHGEFLLSQCLALVEARKPKQQPEDATLSVWFGGIHGRAGVNKITGTFDATIYNNTGYDLSEITFRVDTFKDEKKKKQYEETGAKSGIKPDEARLLRIQQNHPNQSVARYSSPFDEPAEYWVWNAVAAKGVRVPGTKTAAELFFAESSATPAVEATPERTSVTTPTPTAANLKRSG